MGYSGGKFCYSLLFISNPDLFLYKNNSICSSPLSAPVRFVFESEYKTRTSFCSYARPAQPGPNRTRLCGPCIAAIAGD